MLKTKNFLSRGLNFEMALYLRIYCIYSFRIFSEIYFFRVDLGAQVTLFLKGPSKDYQFIERTRNTRSFCYKNVQHWLCQ